MAIKTSGSKLDPDDNGIELYCDHPRSNWPYSSAGKLAMLTRPLDLEALLNTFTEAKPV